MPVFYWMVQALEWLIALAFLWLVLVSKVSPQRLKPSSLRENYGLQIQPRRGDLNLAQDISGKVDRSKI